MIRTATLFAVALTLACGIAPTDVDVVAELTPASVKYRANLGNLRVIEGGLANALPVFAKVAQPSEELLADLPWAGTLTSYRFVPRDGGLELEVRGELPRTVFDGCARAACTGDETDKRCKGFPVRSCDGGYELADLDLEEPPGQLRHFRADGGPFRYRARLDEPVLKHGSSALDVHAVWSRQPEAAKAAADWIERLGTAYEQGRADQLSAMLSRAELEKISGGSAALWNAMKQAALMQRQFLLRAYLRRHGYHYALHGGGPPEPRFHLDDPRKELIPAEPLPEVASLKLRIAFDVAQLGFLERGEVADAQAVIAEACSDKRVRGRAQKRLCALLLLEPGHP